MSHGSSRAESRRSGHARHRLLTLIGAAHTPAAAIVSSSIPARAASGDHWWKDRYKGVADDNNHAAAVADDFLTVTYNA